MDKNPKLTKNEEKLASLLAGAFPARPASGRLSQRVARGAAPSETSSPQRAATAGGALVGAGTLIRSAPRLRLWPAAVAFCAMAALLIVPSSRWIVRIQMAATDFAPRSFAWIMHGLFQSELPGEKSIFSGEEAAARKLVAAHPDDLDLQLGWVSFADSPANKVSQLKALAARIGPAAVIDADILRYSTARDIQFHRVEEDRLTNDKARPEKAPPAADLAAFDATAAEGERLDPENAYFPLMRSIGYFAAHRDAGAMQAISRAAGKPHWDDYAARDAGGAWRIIEEVSGNHSAIAQTAIDAEVPLPHLSRLMAAFRVAIYRAVLADEAGSSRGAAIRLAVFRCAALIRSDSHYGVGSIVGAGAEHRAMLRAGGGAYVKPPEPQGRVASLSEFYASGDHVPQLEVDHFVEYLKRHGQGSAAPWVVSELQAAATSREILRLGAEESVFGGSRLSEIIHLWMADLVAMASILWMLALGGAALFLAHRRLERTALMIIAPLCLGLVVTLILWQRQWWDTLLTLQNVIDVLTIGNAFVRPSHTLASSIITASALGIPAVFLIWAGTASLMRREGLLRGMVRRLQSSAWPLACGLVLVYSVLVAATAWQETRLAAQLTTLTQHEGRYSASLLHQEWPVLPSVK